ncbi:MAG: TIM barrel protein [Pseudomonadota bacterium]
MTAFSANLGFLWTDCALPEAIRAAKRAGFAAVECHSPYDVPAEDVRAVLLETGLPLLALNTTRGGQGAMGRAASPGQESEARADIDQAIAYAEAVDAAAIHVLAGHGSGPENAAVFVRNLRYATEATDRRILIEPLNSHDAPGYFLQTTDQAEAVLAAVQAPNLRLMFDCYHVARTEGDVRARLQRLLPVIGHIQVASVPDRGRPDQGELDYLPILAFLAEQGWTHPIGAEYAPRGPTEPTLGWMRTLAHP